MKLQNHQIEIERNKDFDEVKYSMDASELPLLFKLLRTSMYSNKIGSIVREIASNCVDSHIEAGCSEIPVEIEYVPQDPLLGTDECIVFRDFGVGISPERKNNIFSKYLSSTKRTDNNQIGGFGLGSKSPFAYTDNFYIHTNYDGVAYQYVALIDETGLGSIITLHEEPTDKRNGTEIRIPLKETEDKRKFERELLNQLRYFDNIKFINFNVVPGIIYHSKTFAYSTAEGDTFTQNIHVLIGNVPYPITYRSETFRIGDRQVPIALKFEIGELPVTPSREAIEFSDEVAKVIQAKYDEVADELENHFFSQSIESDSYLQYVIRNVAKEPALTIKLGSAILNVTSILKERLEGKNKLRTFTSERYPALDNLILPTSLEFLFQRFYSTSGVRYNKDYNRKAQKGQKFKNDIEKHSYIRLLNLPDGETLRDVLLGLPTRYKQEMFHDTKFILLDIHVTPMQLDFLKVQHENVNLYFLTPREEEEDKGIVYRSLDKLNPKDSLSERVRFIDRHHRNGSTLQSNNTNYKKRYYYDKEFEKLYQDFRAASATVVDHFLTQFHTERVSTLLDGYEDWVEEQKKAKQKVKEDKSAVKARRMNNKLIPIREFAYSGLSYNFFEPVTENGEMKVSEILSRTGLIVYGFSEDHDTLIEASKLFATDSNYLEKGYDTKYNKKAIRFIKISRANEKLVTLCTKAYHVKHFMLTKIAQRRLTYLAGVAKAISFVRHSGDYSIYKEFRNIYTPAYNAYTFLQTLVDKHDTNAKRQIALDANYIASAHGIETPDVTNAINLLNQYSDDVELLFYIDADKIQNRKGKFREAVQKYLLQNGKKVTTEKPVYK